MLDGVGSWVRDELPALNRAILAGQVAPGVLTDVLREELLPGLPRPECLDRLDAQRLLVHLGFVGASVARHFQQRTPAGKDHPRQAFEGLTVGAAQVPFLAYFAALADHTGTGHCHRDSYASLVRWNVGTVQVRLGDELLSTLPGIFDDGEIRSYTGTGGEQRFFALVKRSEAVELAVNELLAPLGADGARPGGDEAVLRVRTATILLDAMRQLFVTFAGLPAEQSMPAEHFMDVFRQFAVHWTPDDIPPSGALDPEALKRDFLLGVPAADYEAHVRGLFPALLSDERAMIEAVMARPSLPQHLLATLGVADGALATASPAELRRLVGREPALADWYTLLTAHARASGAHLMLSKKFLFTPQNRRDAAGQGDQPLVSNRAGTTGMTETFLQRLTRARRDHLLAPLRRVLAEDIPTKVTTDGVRSPSGPQAQATVTLVA
ncbi:hypothetical protein Ani05nite_24240 [Amorphoplanes nipponensis]|uniref:Indoleamine 2,3-dioxygenase n=1 Tax=Actinoplanes nipponensis TaxID=135950 RepID=A0A919MT99_9ACTN|nr:hypothetical protein [Actinoplanes nipponensis]GIE48890.1 hypothetical protein Ani05nite_24240 [Actinoplanes nipponensis]